MRFKKLAAAAAVAMSIAFAQQSSAELQNVEIGGQLQIRGNYYSDAYGYQVGGRPSPNVGFRWRDLYLSGRPTGAAASYNNFTGNSILSNFNWNDSSFGRSYINQRTRLHINADFTDNVSAFVEVDSASNWGDKGDDDNLPEFRSDYFTGNDGFSDPDVSLYQAYIQTDSTFGVPLRLRIGRQELSFGSGWLVDTNFKGQKFLGLSFDALRATYSTEKFTLDAFASKLAERSGVETDGDTDFYGLYGSLRPIDDPDASYDITIDAYWFLLRDARAWSDTNGFISNFLEEQLGGDDYSPLTMNTVGARTALAKNVGERGTLKVELEGAYQFGEAGWIGGLFRPYNLLGSVFSNSTIFGRNRYGDDSADFDTWAAHLKTAYEVESKHAPKVFMEFAYYGGEDNRSVSFADWMRGNINPFYRPNASVSFNRLFSDTEHSSLLDLDNSLSNVWLVGVGGSFMPTEKVEILAQLYHFEALEAFSSPYSVRLAGISIVPLFPFSFIDSDNKTDLGYEASIHVIYTYSQDLRFQVGWTHLFVNEGLGQGNFNDGNGFFFNGGTDSDDVDYIYAQTTVSF